MTRLFIYLIILSIIISLPFNLQTQTKTDKVSINSPTVKISLVNQVQPKPKPKKKKVQRPKPKPKKKIIKKPRPKPKPKPVKKVEEVEEKLIEKKPEITPVEETFEKVELQEQVVDEVTEPEIDYSAELRQTYYSHIHSTIKQNQIYPKKSRRFGHEGIVKVSFTIRADGSIDSLEIVEPSSYNTLNKAVKKMLKNISFEKPPKELEHPVKISIPIEFTLN